MVELANSLMALGYEPDATPGAAKKKPTGNGTSLMGKFADLKSFMPKRSAKAK